jgi:hypothetical protein
LRGRREVKREEGVSSLGVGAQGLLRGWGKREKGDGVRPRREVGAVTERQRGTLARLEGAGRERGWTGHRPYAGTSGVSLT